MRDKPLREGHQGRLGNVEQPEYVALREVIEEVLERQHLSQRDLSGKLGRPHVYVNRILRGKRSIDWSDLVSLCRAIPVDVTEVVAEAMRRIERS